MYIKRLVQCIYHRYFLICTINMGAYPNTGSSFALHKNENEGNPLRFAEFLLNLNPKLPRQIDAAHLQKDFPFNP